MARVHVQFHADDEELLCELLPRWLSGMSYFYVIRRPDGSIVDRRGQRGPLSFNDDRAGVAEVILRLSPFVATDGTDLDFLRRNAGFLAVSVSHVRDGCLRETAVGSLAEDAESIAAWRIVVRQAKQELLRGAVLVGLDGERRTDSQHLYTSRALELWRQGVRMLSVAGEASYELGQAR